MILLLNAGDKRGIDVVRAEIKSFASNPNLYTQGIKLVILDEADAMVEIAQSALRRLIELNTKKTRFCLICNDYRKIIPALQSRCTKFRFGPLSSEQIGRRLREISCKEEVKLTELGVKAIIDLSRGDMRRCLNILQSTHLAYQEVTEESVYKCLGQPLPALIAAIFDHLITQPLVVTFSFIQEKQLAHGFSLLDLVSAVHDLVCTKNPFPNDLGSILSGLSDIEYQLNQGALETVQLSAFVAIFEQPRLLTPIQERKKNV